MKHLLENQHNKDIRQIAYFSMEVGLRGDIPTYAGGLGVLAGDTIKTFADLIVPAVVITLVSRKGYFKQELRDGQQIEHDVIWNPEDLMKRVDRKVVLSIEGRDVVIGAWKYIVRGVKGFEVPVYFLDTDMDENHPEDRQITNYLYGGDEKYRLRQEAVLGIGGIRLLEALGYRKIKKYHMNEGHAALLTLELLREAHERDEDPDKIKEKCVFTTHTPVKAGHDKFPKEMVKSVLKEFNFELEPFFEEGLLNMTLLGLKNSEYVNGVALRHQEVSKSMFPGYSIDFITNGVHSETWTSKPFRNLFEKHIPAWKHDPFNLRYALSINRKDIWEAHMEAKKKMIDKINELTNVGMEYDVFTIGFARRNTPYKRLDLFFHDINELIKIHDTVGKIQVVMGGKSHPKDQTGKDIIKKIDDNIKKLGGRIKVVYLENYNMSLAKYLISGVDIWINTPRKPLEASGTSGMKAAHNAIPHFSVLDGWWIEGHVENVTGWSIGRKWKPNQNIEAISNDDDDAKDLYIKLKEIILPMYYNDWDKWTEVMRHSIAFNASFFNTHRMVHQYVLNSYFH